MNKISPTSNNNCILCINTTSKTTKIFGSRGHALKIAEILCRHFWFTFNKTDKSKEICVKCWEKTSTFHEFFESVRKAHLHPNENRPKDDDDWEHPDWQSDHGDTDVVMNADEDDDDVDVKYTSQQWEQMVNVDGDAKMSQPLDKMMNANKDTIQTSPELEPITDTLDVERRIAEYFKMNCDLCGEQLSSLDNVKAHFSNKHKLHRGYLICYCNKKAKMRRSIIEHVQWHMNPNMFRCNECSKTFIDKRGLRKHMVNHQAKDEDLLDCSMCAKRFSNQSLLTQHVARVHPPDDQKFECKICQKSFKLKVILEAHIKYKHSGTSQQYICDICAKVLSTKQNLKEHTNTHFDIPRVQCNICGALLKNRICLRIHLKSHTDATETCEICFQVKANRSALNSHRRRVHGTAKHKCNFCEKKFTRLCALREHVATHSGESLYTCNYCPQTFKSNSNMYNRPVLPSVSPGYLHKLIPDKLPEKSQDWKCIMEDIERVIMPGMTHWQSPNFHAFYPAPTSYPSIIGEMISAAFGTVGFSWICSPACTELEVIMMDWLGRFLGLPEVFIKSSGGTGGGVIQGAASEAILVAVLTAREQAVNRLKIKYPDLTESEIRGKLVAYSSDQSNSAIEKAGILAAVPMKLIKADRNNRLTGQLLQAAIDEDLANGKFPVVCVATFGTTGTCSFDNVKEIGPICKENDIWFHIDAACAGAALCCPENRPLMTGIEWADSLNFNLHKWMMVNFDCCAMWFQNSNAVVDAFTVHRIYLDHKHQGASDRAPDFRHWTINLGRRFRSLKVWIVLRTMGWLRAHIRGQIGLAQMFENLVRSDQRFEIVCERSLALVCFRLKGDCSLTKQLLDQVTARKQLYMIHATFNGKLMIRFVICGYNPNEGDMTFAWNEIKGQADILFRSIEELTDKLTSHCAIKTAADIVVEKSSTKFSSCMIGDIQREVEKVK